MKFMFFKFDTQRHARPAIGWLQKCDENGGNILCIYQGEQTTVAIPVESVELLSIEVRPFAKRLKKFFSRITPIEKKRSVVKASIGSSDDYAPFVKPSPIPSLINLRDYYFRQPKNKNTTTPTRQLISTGGKQ